MARAKRNIRLSFSIFGAKNYSQSAIVPVLQLNKRWHLGFLTAKVGRAQHKNQFVAKQQTNRNDHHRFGSVRLMQVQPVSMTHN
jgi:hypothetical protein